MDSPHGTISTVRSVHPLVTHITNQVTMNDCANICICAGGSPVMGCDKDDLVQLTAVSDALLVNMGTIDNYTVDVATECARIAASNGVPIVFDPVGAGATEYRRKTSQLLISEMKPDVIKGNHSEICYLDDRKSSMRGVDSTTPNRDFSKSVLSLAKKTGSIIVSTGEKDYVSDGRSIYELSNGTYLESLMSGTGCMLSSVVATYVGAGGISTGTIIDAVSAFNISAEHASIDCKGPGTFKAALLDELYLLDDEHLSSEKRINRIDF